MLVKHAKKLGKKQLCRRLEDQVDRLRQQHKFQVIAVAGSIGKTSTKLAIAKTLAPSLRVLYQDGNYNDRLTVPLVFFSHAQPSTYNVAAWRKILKANEAIIAADYPYDVVVVELGTDGPGQMQDFAYLHPDITIVTAITPEHMEYFKTMDAVAGEELSVIDYSNTTIVNADDTDKKYLQSRSVLTYGTSPGSAYRATRFVPGNLTSGSARIHFPDKQVVDVQIKIQGAQGLKFALAAAATADQIGLSAEQIQTGLAQIEPFPGRLQILEGIKGSTLIDDTYNASPLAVTAALDVLYATKTKQRISVLGSMNELGDYSEEAHRIVGKHCDPAKLHLVITIGQEAAKYTAPEAEANGCEVITCDSPYAAGKAVRTHIRERAVVLAKGSQNRVFAEESLKSVLAHPADSHKLVRQSQYWINIKKQQFPDFDN